MTIDVSENDSISYARRLALEEGILAGMSSGGSVCAALSCAKI